VSWVVVSSGVRKIFFFSLSILSAQLSPWIRKMCVVGSMRRVRFFCCVCVWVCHSTVVVVVLVVERVRERGEEIEWCDDDDD
jgi:hypothetical protein